MKKSELILIGLVILFLTIHLFTIHSKLLFHINPDNIVDSLTYKFTLELFSQNMIVSTLSALAYSLITALILTVFVKFRSVFLISVISFAVLDGIGVFIYYNVGIKENLFIISGAIYYALYTIFIIISLGLYRNMIYKDIDLNERIEKGINETDVIHLRNKLNKVMNTDKQYLTLEEKIYKYYVEEGWSQQKTAKYLNVSQPTVSRTLAKLKEENE